MGADCSPRKNGSVFRFDTDDLDIGIDELGSQGNAGGKTVNLKVKDQLPLSSEKEIEIKKAKFIPESGSLNENNGVITWEFTLAPGATQETVVSYQVKYPSDKTLDSTL